MALKRILKNNNSGHELFIFKILLKILKYPGKRYRTILVLSSFIFTFIAQRFQTRRVFVYKIKVNPIHTILKYGIYYDIMDR